MSAGVKRLTLAAAAVAIVAIVAMVWMVFDYDHGSEPIDRQPVVGEGQFGDLPGPGPENRGIAPQRLQRVIEAARSAAGGGKVLDVERSTGRPVSFEVELAQRGREVSIALDGDLQLRSQQFDPPSPRQPPGD